MSGRRIGIFCQGGVAQFQLAVIVDGVTDSSPLVGPGDEILVNIVSDGGDTSALVLNLTRNVSIVSTGSAGADEMLFGALPVFLNTDLTPVPDFGALNITGRLNDKELKKAEKLNRKSGGQTKISTGELKKGTFTLTFKNS